MALGLPLWGLKIYNPGWTLLITAEDQRERLIARLREICKAQGLSSEQTAEVFSKVLVMDVSSVQDAKLTMLSDGNIIQTSFVDEIIETYRDNPPALMIFDPLISFGASEAMVNDNEQALIHAARRIIAALECCVRYVHHTGKGNARDGLVDQYSSRGGSALPDGARMVTVLTTYDPKKDKDSKPPQTLKIDSDSSVTILHRPKLSYTKPNLPKIWIKRTGFRFEHHEEVYISDEDQMCVHAAQIVRFMESQAKDGNFYTQRLLDPMADRIGMTRTQIRAAIAYAMAGGDIVNHKAPEAMRHGRLQTILIPSHCTGLVPA